MVGKPKNTSVPLVDRTVGTDAFHWNRLRKQQNNNQLLQQHRQRDFAHAVWQPFFPFDGDPPPDPQTFRRTSEAETGHLLQRHGAFAARPHAPGDEPDRSVGELLARQPSVHRKTAVQTQQKRRGARTLFGIQLSLFLAQRSFPRVRREAFFGGAYFPGVLFLRRNRGLPAALPFRLQSRERSRAGRCVRALRLGGRLLLLRHFQNQVQTALSLANSGRFGRNQEGRETGPVCGRRTFGHASRVAARQKRQTYPKQTFGAERFLPRRQDVRPPAQRLVSCEGVGFGRKRPRVAGSAGDGQRDRLPTTLRVGQAADQTDARRGENQSCAQHQRLALPCNRSGRRRGPGRSKQS